MPPLSRGTLLLVAALVAGCSPPAPVAVSALPVTGTVLLDGQPLPDGGVTFVQAGPAGVVAGGSVSDGQFTLTAAQGTYRVEVRRPVAADGSKGKKGMVRKAESLPARYNAQSKLTAEVTAAGPNRFEFKLTSGK